MRIASQALTPHVPGLSALQKIGHRSIFKFILSFWRCVAAVCAVDTAARRGIQVITRFDIVVAALPGNSAHIGTSCNLPSVIAVFNRIVHKKITGNTADTVIARNRTGVVAVFNGAAGGISGNAANIKTAARNGNIADAVFDSSAIVTDDAADHTVPRNRTADFKVFDCAAF